MRTPKRIDINLFDDNLKALIGTSTKIFPVDYSYIQMNTNPHNYEYVKVVTPGEHWLEIYNWVDLTWVLIGADDKRVNYGDLYGIPETFPPEAHTHSDYALTSHSHADLHTHSNKSLLDNLDQTDLDKWNNYLETLINHEQRLQTLEGGYSSGHAHTNLQALDKIVYTGTAESVDLKAVADVPGHIVDSTAHVTQTDKNNWNAKTKVTINVIQPTDNSLWFKLT